METLTRPPQTPVRPRSIADAPRRWPRVFALGLVLVLLVAATAAFAYLRTYQPLTAGTGVSDVRPPRAVVATLDAFGGDDGDFRQSYVRWEKGRTIHIQFPLWNRGRLPVTIVGPTDSQTERGSSIDVRIAGTGPVTGPDSGHLTAAFSPFTLRPGEGVQLFVDVKMVRTVDRASDAVVSSVRLDYVATRMTHHVTLFMNQSLYLCGGRCPP